MSIKASFPLEFDKKIKIFTELTANFISQVNIPQGNVPLLLSKGIVYCHTFNGRLNTVLLRSHKTETVVDFIFKN